MMIEVENIKPDSINRKEGTITYEEYEEERDRKRVEQDE